MTEAPSSADAPIDPARAARRALRQRLLAEREAFLSSPAAAAASLALAAALREVIAELQPECLGLYCAFPSEFNAVAALAADRRFADLPLALPYARRVPKAMEFRRWDGAAPGVADECGIGSCAGTVVVPDVVVVPCVGFTDAGHRLGYGGGYYDRWLAAHPEATTVGVAWSSGRIDPSTFAAEPHDIPLALIVTEQGPR
ncbi:MAG: 5-formyltetrahydrofolate cyclo-ligase [Burkholderiales bacterium]|nr:5-formyltetrahydrofolate cyclo-ligase [Burkholderiales bacterium]